jgi:hypothetical protein
MYAACSMPAQPACNDHTKRALRKLSPWVLSKHCHYVVSLLKVPSQRTSTATVILVDAAVRPTASIDRKEPAQRGPARPVSLELSGSVMDAPAPPRQGARGHQDFRPGQKTTGGDTHTHTHTFVVILFC